MNTDEMEIDLVLEAIRLTSGSDFRLYTRPSLRRRITDFASRVGVQRPSEMIPEILHNPTFLRNILQAISIPVTEMFRDPSFFTALRSKVFPDLRKLPVLKIWHAGCATGEEVYSMAIWLHEAGLHERATLYGTDFNASALQTAREGIYSSDTIKTATANYHAAGGIGNFSDYYHTDYQYAKVRDFLRYKTVFSQHNLAIDGPFGDMDLILCRNVIIYFERSLKDRVFVLFQDSLQQNGFLCLGRSEAFGSSDIRQNFQEIVALEKIYRQKISVPDTHLCHPEMIV